MFVRGSTLNLVMIGIFAVFVVLAMVDPVFAQEEAADGASEVTVMQNLKNAGYVGFLIILLSMAGVALIITFAMQFRRDNLVPQDLLAHVEQLFEEEDYDAALEVCESNPSYLSSVLAAGLPKIDRPYHEIEVAMEDSGDQEAARMHQKVGYLSLIASVAPMMGLLGTVLGMVKSFNIIATSQTSPKPKDLAKGISEALMTTMMGLCVAIPMSVAYFIFKNKVNNSIIEVSNLATELMERFDTPEAR